MRFKGVFPCDLRPSPCVAGKAHLSLFPVSHVLPRLWHMHGRDMRRNGLHANSECVPRRRSVSVVGRLERLWSRIASKKKFPRLHKISSQILELLALSSLNFTLLKLSDGDKCEAFHPSSEDLSVLSPRSGKSDVSVKFCEWPLRWVCVLRQYLWALSECGGLPQGLTPAHWSPGCSGRQPNTPIFSC